MFKKNLIVAFSAKTTKFRYCVVLANACSVAQPWGWQGEQSPGRERGIKGLGIVERGGKGRT